MDQNTDLYAILGAEKGASEAELKKAYRKASLKYHPDRIPQDATEAQKKEAEEKMAEVNFAWSVLSDPDKRQKYDQFGMSGINGNGGFDPFEMFRNSGGGGFSFNFGGDDFDIGEMFGFGSSRRSGQQRERIVPGQDLQVRIKIDDISEIFKPKEHKIRYKRKKRCPECHGAGGFGEKICPTCNGRGTVTVTQRTQFGIMQQTRPCQECNGTGKIYEKKCQRCSGSGFTEETVEKTIMFPEGVLNGQCIIYESEGSEAKKTGHPNGRLIAIAEYAFDKRYTVENGDVREVITIPYEDCILGTKYEFHHPDGSIMNINIAPLTPPGKRLILRGRGLNGKDQFGNKFTGNYYLEIKYGLPAELSSEEKEILEDIRSIRK